MNHWVISYSCIQYCDIVFPIEEHRYLMRYGKNYVAADVPGFPIILILFPRPSWCPRCGGCIDRDKFRARNFVRDRRQNRQAVRVLFVYDIMMMHRKNRTPSVYHNIFLVNQKRQHVRHVISRAFGFSAPMLIATGNRQRFLQIDKRLSFHQLLLQCVNAGTVFVAQ